MKLYSIFVLLIASLSCGMSHAKDEIKVELECTVTGTKVSGERASKPFIEKILVEQAERPTTSADGKVKTWTIRSAELNSDGKKVEPSLIAATSEYAVIAYTNSIGNGYSKKLLVFTYLLDLKAFELTRLVSSLPAGADERTQNACKQK